jgi:hypothetical protein
LLLEEQLALARAGGDYGFTAKCAVLAVASATAAAGAICET